MTNYCTVAQIKQRLSGDTPVMDGRYDATLATIVAEISADIDREVSQARGCRAPWTFVADSAASPRSYVNDYGPTEQLLIDDCVSVASVTIVNQGGATQLLAAGTDYVPWPLSGTPIVGLRRVNGVWPTFPGQVSVSAKWGYAVNAPLDVEEVAILEGIRAYEAAKAGVDDRVGVATGLGTITITKTWVGKFSSLKRAYSFGAGGLR